MKSFIKFSVIFIFFFLFFKHNWQLATMVGFIFILVWVLIIGNYCEYDSHKDK
jgi:hypothetical protein